MERGKEEKSLIGPDLHGIRGVGRGRLKIYLGWAPGVGKTRRALLDLRALSGQGVDVVLGWLEEKSRPDLVEIAEGLERIPPTVHLRSGTPIHELDLAAILNRRPATLFIDELAGNPGGKAEGQKLWQMVEDLLEEGISVITTLNGIQISALSGPASQILGHPVQETVPVEFVQRADELVLVDIPPAELLARIQAGGVFRKKAGERFLPGPFTEANLERLREMTLTFAAKVLDTRLTRQGGEKGIFERVTVLVSSHPESFRTLLAYGSTLARHLGGELFVLHLEKIPFWRRRSHASRTFLEDHRKAVSEAGGKLSVIHTRNIALTLWRFIERTRTTRIVLGHAGTLHPWRSSLVRSVLHHFPRIDVEVNLVPTIDFVMPDLEKPSQGPLEGMPAMDRERRGRFTLFLGAAAGIGKTYRMLQIARDRQEEGVRVVIGYLETHGRRETEAMARGLPILPRKRVPYRGLLLEELDVDAVLSVRPELVLIDELAHTNPSGFASDKRYKDVSRILATGIDVFSTLNVQHIESLNDLVELQTGIRVRETVPDGVVAMADDLVLVDLTPEELQKRLLEGKVYPAEKVEHSLENFFTVKNLTALREFAFTSVLRPGVGAGPYPVRGGILLIGVSSRPEDAALIRRGARLSERLGLRLVAFKIQQGERDEGGKPDGLEDLVGRLGGEFRVERSPSWEEHFIERCREIRPAMVLLGQSAWHPGTESTAEKIAKKLTSFPMLIVPLDIRAHRER